LWVRRLDSLSAQSFPGTDDAIFPFWSPDSRSIAFFAQGRLKRVEVSGGPPQALSEAPSPRGGTWNRDNVIVFAPVSNGPLSRVTSAGGASVLLTKLAKEQTTHRSPSFLPDGHHFLYYAFGSSEFSGVLVGTLDSGESKRIVLSDTGAVYSPSGDLLFVRQGILFRQHFDLTKLQVSGDAIPIAEPVSVNTNMGAFSISQDGALSYRTGTAGEDVVLSWLDRTGKLIETLGSPAPYRGVEVSPDGSRVAVHRHDPNGGDIWVFEPSRGPMSRQTFDPAADNSSPIWSSDGKQITFGALHDGKWATYTKVVNGSSQELIYEWDGNAAPMSWSPDGENIVVRLVDAKTTRGADEWIVSIKEKKATPLLHETANELRAQVSPDGKWIAYEFNETGRSEVYLKAFPSGQSKHQLSANGGIAPRWRGDGKELFFITDRGKMAAVKLSGAGSTLNISSPTELFESEIALLNHPGGSSHFYAVSRDGTRFLIPRLQANGNVEAETIPITVIVNWFATLK
jgi:eukaryotic-like serine/threonine-protein kinase